MPKPVNGQLTEEQIVENLPLGIIVSTILACGTLNHVPERWTKGNLLDFCVKKVQDSREVDAKTWLNTVYALVVLGVTDESVIASVLSKSGNIKY